VCVWVLALCFDAGSAKRGALIFFFVLFMLLLPFFLLEAYYKFKYGEYLGALLQIVIYLMLAVYEVPSPNTVQRSKPIKCLGCRPTGSTQ
jgi:hypothetical protein